MASLTIVSGSPGTGKTTISAELARRAPRGVHLVSDDFYYFISDLIAPSTTEAADQNRTVITAAARAAVAFASDGYDVVIDGVFGPWNLPLITTELRPADVAIDYVILTATLEESLSRVAERDAPAMDAIVRKMHGEFVGLSDFERHVVDTQGRTVDEVLEEIARGQTQGTFRV